MSSWRKDYPCRLMQGNVKYSDLYVFPSGLYRVAKVEIEGVARDHDRRALHIRDRSHDGPEQFSIAEPSETGGRSLLPAVAAIVKRRFPRKRLVEYEDAVALARKGVHIDELTTVLVRELPPHLAPNRVNIYYYAPTYFRGPRFTTSGTAYAPDLTHFYGDDEEDDDAEGHLFEVPTYS